MISDLRKPDCMRATKERISLVIAFVIFRSIESAIAKLATYELSIFFLVSVAEQADSSLIWAQTQKTGFLMTWTVPS